jgi:hypothetical protein
MEDLEGFLLQLFADFRSGSEDVGETSRMLSTLLTNPDVIPILAQIYGHHADNFTRHLILIGYHHILKTLFTLTPLPDFSELQDILVSILSVETDRHLLSDAATLAVAIFSQTRATWPSLSAFLESNAATPEVHIFILEHFASHLDPLPDPGRFLAVVAARCDAAFQGTFPDQVSAFCLMMTFARSGDDSLLQTYLPHLRELLRCLVEARDRVALTTILDVLDCSMLLNIDSDVIEAICPTPFVVEQAATVPIRDDVDYSILIALREYLKKRLWKITGQKKSGCANMLKNILNGWKASLLKMKKTYL